MPKSSTAPPGTIDARHSSYEKGERIIDPVWTTALGHLSELFNMAMRLTGSRPAAEDLVQETYRTVFERSDQLRDISRCRAWLFRILRNLHLDAVRRDRAGPDLRIVHGESASAGEPGIGALDPGRIDVIDSTDIRRALGTLSEEFRTALVLCDVEGFRYEEIAEIMECPVGTVRSRIARARERIAAELGYLAGRSRTERNRGRP